MTEQNGPISRREFTYPTRILYGPGRAGEIAAYCKEAGIEKPLLVTDSGLARTPMISAMTEALMDAGMDVGIYAGARPNPIKENLDEGIAAYQAGGHDGVLAVGGGSGLDTGKLIALMQGQSISVFDLEDVGDWWKRADASKIAPVVAVPTTAGTGSEVGRAAVLTHPGTHEKKIIFHPAMMPKIAVLDPQLTTGLPPFLTAATGMDAFSHCLEAYCAPGYHPLAEGIALEGMYLVKNNLPAAVRNGTDLVARGNMMMASVLGGTAFQRGLGAIHALSHPFGGLYDKHHGLLNGIILPFVLNANRPAIEAAIQRVANALDIAGGFDGFLQWVLELRQATDIPETLPVIAIDAARVDEVAAMAIRDPSAACNPIQFSQEEYRKLALRCIEGGDLTR